MPIPQVLLQHADISPNTEHSSTAKALDQIHLIPPKKLHNPILESASHRGLHRELLLSHKHGLLPEEKPELKRVLEQRRNREREEDSQSPSDLERELSKRRQKLQEYEQEEMRRREDLQNMPEFVRVRESLRHISVTSF
ncbi:hypothetical protein DNTS_004989 [Danionella cerebrum]|uniref:Uncharacterized protein n=1 Tax=Danionella cerebrum TaxID=2873325 RepID=A0A553RLD0_9TELE|nr:hypothetical protein DNTS_004989 [Danionella translucida]